MKDFKGTPGPWFVDGTSVWDREVTPEKDCEEDANYVAEVFSDLVEQSEADAKLIAAAPELLEALQGILECHESILFNEFGVESDLCTTKARDAIKKALGE